MSTQTAATVTTDEQIETLRTEAAAAGDGAQVSLCDAAMAGDDSARLECARVIADAAALADDADDADAESSADYVWNPAHADFDGQDSSGTLEDALAYAAAWGEPLKLSSPNGEHRGWVKPSGDYSLR